METAQKPRKLRLPSILKRKKEEPPSTQSNATETSQKPSYQDFGDRQRVLERYTEAAHALKESIQASQSYQRGSFEFPELNGEPENFNDSRFRNKINEVLEARKNAFQDQKTWVKCQQAALSVFSALSPFAKNFLAIAKEGQAVIVPYYYLSLTSVRYLY